MNFIQPKKLKALMEAAGAGDVDAKRIVDKYMENDPDMDAIERMMGEYYGLPHEEAPVEQVKENLEEDVHEDVASGAEEQLTMEELQSLNPSAPIEQPKVEDVQVEVENAEPTVSVEEAMQGDSGAETLPSEQMPEEESFDDIEREMDGLIDDDEFDDESFDDFLKKKKINANRALKGADFFKSFDEGHRGRFSQNKKEAYARSFDGRMGKIDRKARDNANAISSYLTRVSDYPEDEFELNQESINGAYGGIVDNDIAMGAFGRSWDENDETVMTDILSNLVSKFGKKNVIAALNVMSDDNTAWSDNARERIKTSIERYGKSLDSLLK